jgi:hypothetical protein
MIVALEGVPYRIALPRAAKPNRLSKVNICLCLIGVLLEPPGPEGNLDSLLTFSSYVFHRPS